MNSKREYAKNTIMLLIGKFCTQFISLLLVPLYTHYLITSDYGTVDLIQTYILLFVPILTLKLDSVIFRFLVDKRDDVVEKENIITNVSFLVLLSVIIVCIICIISQLFLDIKYLRLAIINIIILMTSNVFLQLLRGLGKNLQYSIASVITGIVTLVTNISLILGFKFGAESILIASSIANIVCLIYIAICTKFYKFVKIKRINKKTVKEMLKYSLPMIPNSLSWWIVNVSDRTIISLFLGTAFNGIYTVSCKFSNILNSVYSIFNMSWQETAILHIKDKEKNTFFSDMINKLFMLFSSVGILILAILPFVYNIIIGEDYITSYNYIPILLYANSWNVLIGLIGGIYVALKRTKEVANTTIVSAIINIIVNLLCIKFIGLYAACISTLIAYLIMSIYRYRDCQKYVKVRLNVKGIIIFTILFILSSACYLYNNLILNIINLIVIVIYILVINKYLIKFSISFLQAKKHN